MSTASTPGDRAATVVYLNEPPRKAPPSTIVGPLAWLRDNLFRSTSDTILTIIAGVIAVISLVSTVNWAIREANWYAITFNLRPLMVGRFQPDFEWRLILLLVLTCAGIGLALAAWTKLRRWLWIALAVSVALLFVVPALINAVIPLPPTYFAAGVFEFGSGPTAERPQERVAFVGRAGETVTLQLETRYSASLQTLGDLHSFGDNIVGRLVNTANARFTLSARSAELAALLAGDTLTASQRRILEAEQQRTVVPEDILQQTQLNQQPVTVRILDGATLEPLGEATLDAGSAPLSVTLPADGWYVLEKRVASEGSVALLQATGIYPILERSITRSAPNGSIERVDQFVRMTDVYLSEAARPVFDGDEVPFTVITDMQYRGEHSFANYLRLYVDPFLALLAVPFLVMALSFAGGYFGGRLLDRTMPNAERPRQASRRAATWLLAALPVLMFFLVYGIGFGNILPLSDPRTWGGLLLTILLTVWGIVISLPLGILLALGRRSTAGVPLSPLLNFKWGGREVRFQPKLPIVSLLCTFYIELVRGVPFITVLFMAQLLLPLVNPGLADFPGAFRATIATILFSAAYLAETVRGGLQAIPPGQEEAAKALGLNGFQITLQITLPQALRIVIPAIMGSFVALFKDTSLVTIVGLLDLTGMADNINAQTEFLGLRRETLFFISIIYFVFCWGMAAVSQRLERTGAGAAVKQQI
jgi:ABC-type amino acid transport system permease subunit